MQRNVNLGWKVQTVRGRKAGTATSYTQRFLAFQSSSLSYLFKKKHTAIWCHFKGTLVPVAYCCKVPIYVVLDAVQNESSYCCGTLLKRLSLSCCLAKPFELMISQFIWKRSLPGQPSMQIQFTGSYHRVVMGIFSHRVVGQFDHYCSEHMLLITAHRGRLFSLFVWKK